MENKTLLGIILIPAFILLVPLAAMQFTHEVTWGLGDFIMAWVLMAGVGFAYKLATRQTGNVAYRAGVGVGLATCFLLIWINLAVGFIGGEDNPANLMYGGVLAVAAIGAAIARWQSEGMARAMFAAATGQFLVPVIAFFIWRPEVNSGLVRVLAFNTVFSLLFVGSGLLFRAARQGVVARADKTA